MSETVYDSFMNIKCLVDTHPEYFKDEGIETKYDIYESLKTLNTTDKRVYAQDIPIDKGQRPSDMVAYILEGYGLTRQEYVDIVRLHLFQTYLAGFKQQNIYQGVGSLKVMLEDIPGLLRLVPDGFPSNMIYHAHHTYERISEWIRINWISLNRFSRPCDLLLEIYSCGEIYESLIGAQCFNYQLYNEGIDERADYDLKHYHYDSMLNDISLSMQWKHFFVYVMDYRIEQVYNVDYESHFIDLIKIIRMSFSSDFSDIVNCLATGMEAVNIYSKCNIISDELYLQRVYISHFLLFLIDVYKSPRAMDYRIDFMVEQENKERYGTFDSEIFTFEESDISETRFKEMIEARTRAKHRFKKEMIYADTDKSMIKSNEGRNQFIQAFYQLIQKDPSEDIPSLLD